MKRAIFISYTALMIAVAAIGYSIFIHLQRPRIACVDLSKVYEEFLLQDELHKKLLPFINRADLYLDSLELGIRTLKTAQANGDTKYDALIPQMEEEFYYKQQEFDLQKDELSKDYDRQVWERLNTYMADYGKTKGYTFIFGASGNGSIMYAETASNITAEVIEYVNARYNGEK